jgi:hypothetical protein
MTSSAERTTVVTETVNTLRDAIEYRRNIERAAIFRCFACWTFRDTFRVQTTFLVLSNKPKQIPANDLFPWLRNKQLDPNWARLMSTGFVEEAKNLLRWLKVRHLRGICGHGTLRIFFERLGSIEVKFEASGMTMATVLWSWLNRKAVNGLWDRKFDCSSCLFWVELMICVETGRSLLVLKRHGWPSSWIKLEWWIELFAELLF